MLPHTPNTWAIWACTHHRQVLCARHGLGERLSRGAGELNEYRQRDKVLLGAVVQITLEAASLVIGR